MTETELVMIRRRATKAEDTTQAERDRRALLQELDRVRALWDDCRAHCFDPSEVKPPFAPMGPTTG